MAMPQEGEASGLFPGRFGRLGARRVQGLLFKNFEAGEAEMGLSFPGKELTRALLKLFRWYGMHLKLATVHTNTIEYTR